MIVFACCIVVACCIDVAVAVQVMVCESFFGALVRIYTQTLNPKLQTPKPKPHILNSRTASYALHLTHLRCSVTAVCEVKLTLSLTKRTPWALRAADSPPTPPPAQLAMKRDFVPIVTPLFNFARDRSRRLPADRALPPLCHLQKWPPT